MLVPRRDSPACLLLNTHTPSSTALLIASLLENSMYLNTEMLLYLMSMSAMFISGLLVDLFCSYILMFFALSTLSCTAIVAVLRIRERKTIG